MKWVLRIAGGLLVLAIIAAIITPYVLPDDVLKQPIIEQVEKAIGHKIHIDGKFSVRLFPLAGASMENVTIYGTGADGNSSTTPLATLKSLDIRVEAVALALDQEVIVKKLALEEPDVNLVAYPSGHANWEPSIKKSKEEESPNVRTARNSKPTVPNLTFNDVSITDGRISYHGKDDKGLSFNKFSINSSLDGMNKPFTMSGKMEWENKPLSFTLSMDSLQNFFVGSRAVIEATVKNDLISLESKGAYEGLVYSGHVKLASSSLKDLINQMNITKNPIDIKNKLELNLEGDVRCSWTECQLAKTSLALDDAKLQGDFGVRFDGPKPIINVNVAAGALDLTPFAQETKAESPFAPIPDAVAVEGEKPIDFSGLNAADANVALTTDSLKFQKFTVEKSTIRTKLENGKLSANMVGAQLYGGTCDVVLHADASGSQPTFQKLVTLKSVDAAQLLDAVSGNSRLSGKINLDSSMTSYGNTRQQLVSHANGNGKFALSNGAIHGFNLLDVIHNLQSAIGGATTSSGETKFTSLTGSFVMKDGVATNNDLVLDSQVLDATGTGQINLVNNTVNYRITPKVGGDQGLGIPILVSGNLDSPSFKPDVKSAVKDILKSPSDARTGAKNALKSLKGLLKNSQQ